MITKEIIASATSIKIHELEENSDISYGSIESLLKDHYISQRSVEDSFPKHSQLKWWQVESSKATLY